MSQSYPYRIFQILRDRSVWVVLVIDEGNLMPGEVPG